MYSVKNINILGWGLNWSDSMKEPSTAFPEKEADSAAERKHKVILAWRRTDPLIRETR